MTRIWQSIALAAALGIAGCQTVDQIDKSALEANRSIASYNAASSLLNIVRARLDEPPVFAPVTGLTGHNTLSGTLGLPTVTVGGVNPAQAVFGSNSATRSVSADFNVNPPDDAAVNKALSTPLDPGTLGLLEAQGYPRDLLLYLFVDEIRIEKPGMATRIFVNDPFHEALSISGTHSVIVGEHLTTWSSPFTGQAEFGSFGSEIEALLSRGLTFQVDRQGYSATQTRPVARICLDDAEGFQPETPPPNADPAHVDAVRRMRASVLAANPPPGLPDCATTPWPSEPTQAPAPKNPKAVAATAPIDRLADAVAAALNGPKLKPTSNEAYCNSGVVGNRIRFHIRSIAGVYRYVGALSRNHISVDISDGSGWSSMLDIRNQAEGCYTGFFYENAAWCVP